MLEFHYPSYSESNSPNSVVCFHQRDQHRKVHVQHSLHLQLQNGYQSMPLQAAASLYAMTMSPQNDVIQHTQSVSEGTAQKTFRKIAPEPLLGTQLAHPYPTQQSHFPQDGGQVQSPGNTAPSDTPGRAPGPIPALAPLVVRQDGNGASWIAFEYAQGGVLVTYNIQCDVESVNIEELSPRFKEDNCIYKRAYCLKGLVKKRLQYETDCNRVGWALAELNIPLRGSRCLIQRAVNSWRNNNSDVRLRSRRVRRMENTTQ